LLARATYSVERLFRGRCPMHSRTYSWCPACPCGNPKSRAFFSQVSKLPTVGASGFFFVAADAGVLTASASRPQRKRLPSRSAIAATRMLKACPTTSAHRATCVPAQHVGRCVSAPAIDERHKRGSYAMTAGVAAKNDGPTPPGRSRAGARHDAESGRARSITSKKWAERS
jgi:hypothetical protein